jgi:hypothetical protein
LPANLQNGLVGYWPFCGNANDESGNGNNGTVNGATLTEDRFGVANAAYSFDGNDDINFGMNDEFGVITGVQRTFSLWINSVSGGNVLSKYENYGPNNSNFLLAFTLSDSALRLAGNGTNVINYDPLSNGNWYHVVGVYDGINNLNQLFINGELVAFGSLNLSNSVSTQPMYAGRVGGEPFYYTGLIDDISFWNRALTTDEVQQLYTLNACTFTVYDTLTIENVVNVYDTTTVIETIFDTVTVVETLYETVYDTVSVSTTDTLIINTLITAVQPAQENTFLVYPNPAGSQITINNGNVGILGGYTMRITNSAGQEVYNQNITQTEVTLDLGSWGGNGLYVLYIVDPQGEIIAVKQIVLQ